VIHDGLKESIPLVSGSVAFCPLCSTRLFTQCDATVALQAITSKTKDQSNDYTILD
jgi:hypothetical protein